MLTQPVGIRRGTVHKGMSPSWQTGLMRVVIAPDSFTGTLSAEQAAAAIAAGWARTSPHDELICRPLSDGGPGFLAALSAALGGRFVPLSVTGPLGTAVSARFLLTQSHSGGEIVPDLTGWIESASAAGLDQVPPDGRDPTVTTSRGVGELIAAAIRAGARRVVVGVGGTGVCDAGAGLLAGMGASPAPGLSGGGAELSRLSAVSLAAACELVAGVRLEVATDVDVPLTGPRGAARGFGPQKGATPAQVDLLEHNLARFARLLGRTADGRDPAVALGAGAGGGIGFALLRLGATRVAGIETVMEATSFAALAASSDLVITGEGALDWQSLAGKVIPGVAAASAAAGVPTIALAGRVDLIRSDVVQSGLAAAYGASVAGAPVPDPDLAAVHLADLAARVARTWSRH